MRATKAIIHLDNLKGNFEAVRELLASRKSGSEPLICAIVKADAYGHGAAAISRVALDAGAYCVAVATVGEGVELRKAGIKEKILLLSQAHPEEIKEIAEFNLIPLISDSESAEALNACACGQPLELHIKVDTGMGRLGCRPEKAAELAAFIVKSKNLRLGGMATHFSCSGSTKPEGLAYTKAQIEKFRSAAEAVRAAGIDPGILHAANSSAVCFHPDSYFDMVRPGILLYGYNSDKEASLDLKPVMEVRSVISFIKKVHAGEAVSYSRAWIAKEDTFIGTIPIGYADGLPRLLANKQHPVLIRGKVYHLIGRICMDQCMVDLGTNTEVQRWDEAVIFGPGAANADDIADKLGTVSYDVLCGINKRVPRVYM